MRVYYKATRPDGTDFYSGTVDYAAALASGKRLRVRTPAVSRRYKVCTSDVLHAADLPEATLVGGSWPCRLVGGSWPCRLFEVTGRPDADDGKHKFGFRSLVVVREVEAWRALGPQGREIMALIDRARSLTGDEARELAAAWDAARNAAWYAARDAARDATRDATRDAARAAAGDATWYAAWYAAWDAAWYATRNAAGALVVRDLIPTGQYDTLTRPWRQVTGPLHPDDKELR